MFFNDLLNVKRLPFCFISAPKCTAVPVELPVDTASGMRQLEVTSRECTLESAAVSPSPLLSDQTWFFVKCQIPQMLQQVLLVVL